MKVISNSDNLNMSPSVEWDSVWDTNFMQKYLFRGRHACNTYFLELLRKRCNSNSNVADLGCGASFLTLHLCSDISSLTAFDSSNSALRIARKNAQNLGVTNVSFKLQDCVKLDIKSNTYDLVWSQGLIANYSVPDKVIREHIRICKHGGTVLIAVPYLYSYFYFWYIFTRPRIFRKFWPWGTQHFYTKRKLIEVFSRIRKGVIKENSKLVPVGISADVSHFKYRIFFMKPFISGIILIEVKKI